MGAVPPIALPGGVPGGAACCHRTNAGGGPRRAASAPVRRAGRGAAPHGPQAGGGRWRSPPLPARRGPRYKATVERSGRKLSEIGPSVTSAELPVEEPVRRLIGRLGLGSLDGSELSSHPGRNDNWSGVTDTGAAVFVKKLRGGAGESLRRYRRIMAFERMAGDAPDAVPHPELLGGDEENRLLAFALLDDVRSGSELAADDGFGPELAHTAGRTLAALHRMPHRADALPRPDPHPFPPTEDLRELPLHVYLGATGAFIQAWGLLQRDRPLIGALERLRASEDGRFDVPVHGDLRLDQFLVTDGRLYLSDWEEFRLGDPARDIGAFAGEWLHRAVLRIPVDGDAGEPLAGALTHEQVVARGSRELGRVVPLVASFWQGYREGGGPAAGDPGLAERATGYAGWHLIDRLIASTRENGRLSAIVRAAAGIGRTAVLDPGGFVSTVGFGEAA